jgi:hypothetical protein
MGERLNMKTMQIISVAALLLITAAAPLLSADVHQQADQKQNRMLTYDYTEANEPVITFHLGELLTQQVTTDQGVFTEFQIPDAGFIGDLGRPELPAVTKLLAVPTTSCTFEIIDAHVQHTMTVPTIYPMQPPQADDGNDQAAFVYDASAYQQDTVLPGHLVDLVGDGTIRDIPFVKLRFCPVQYNSAEQRVTVYDTIVVTLRFSPTACVTVEPDYKNKPLYPLYETVFDNWQQFASHTTLIEQTGSRDVGCDYLIITHQNWYSQAQQLAAWKHMTGLSTKVVNVSDIGTTYQQIRTYLINAYATWTPKPSYVLLIGDADFIPTTYINGEPTDLWYAAVDGSDYYPDLCIGRIPAKTPAQATLMINKTLTYEQTPPTLPSFYTNFVVAAYFQDDDTNGYEDRRFVLTSEEVRDYLQSQGYTGQRIYFTESYVNPTHYNNDYYAHGEPLPAELLKPTFAWDGDAADICNALNQGIFILNHRDHGMETGWGEPAFTIDDFDNFANGDLLPVVFSLNCLTGKFDTMECFCEEFLRKTDGGAVAAFGATDISYSGYNDYLCRGMYDGLWSDFDTQVGGDISLHTLGEILNYGKAYMAQTWGDPWGEEEYTFELFHCFGDPALDLYTALPGELQVTYELLADTIHVTVTGNGNPIQGARVCLSQDTGFYQTGITDTDGTVEFDTTGVSVEQPVTLGAIAHNYLYHTENFMLNQRPEKPDRPTGPAEGKPNVEYMFRTSTTDPDDDPLCYNFSWGDGTYSDWVGPFVSGAEAFAKHTWAEQGNYNVTVKAKDDKGAESVWSDPLAIVMPLGYSSSTPLLQWMYQILLSRFPFLGAIVERMIMHHT